MGLQQFQNNPNLYDNILFHHSEACTCLLLVFKPITQGFHLGYIFVFAHVLYSMNQFGSNNSSPKLPARFSLNVTLVA